MATGTDLGVRPGRDADEVAVCHLGGLPHASVRCVWWIGGPSGPPLTRQIAVSSVSAFQPHLKCSTDRRRRRSLREGSSKPTAQVSPSAPTLL